MSSGEQSDLDTALDVLANAFRRRLLVALLERDPQVPVTPGDPPIEGEPSDRWSTYPTHAHLPKLDDTGFVEWDWEGGEVRRGPEFENITPLLKLLTDHADKLVYEWP
jgi:hypothetical protein